MLQRHEFLAVIPEYDPRRSDGTDFQVPLIAEEFAADAARRGHLVPEPFHW